MIHHLAALALMACEERLADSQRQQHHEATRNGCDCVREPYQCQAVSKVKGGWPWTCTRPIGHTGPHRACSTCTHNILQWENHETLKGYKHANQNQQQPAVGH